MKICKKFTVLIAVVLFFGVAVCPLAFAETSAADNSVEIDPKFTELEGESTFEVRTPTAITGVRGTVFEIEVEEAPQELTEEI